MGLLRTAAVWWIVSVACWMCIVAVPFLGIRWMPIEWPEVIAPHVAIAALVHALAMAAAFGIVMAARHPWLSRARSMLGTAGMLGLLVVWVPLAWALWWFRPVSQGEMFRALLVDWSIGALVIGAWVSMGHEQRPGIGKWWRVAVVLAWLSVVVLGITVPMEFAGIALPRRFLAPIRWANGLHLAALLCSIPVALRVARAAAGVQAERSAALRGSMLGFERRFAEIRRKCEQAIVQLDARAIRHAPDRQMNSVAVIMKHVGGNLRSRFSDLLHSDGEKPWRDRDAEFIDDFPPGEAGREAALEAWREGWRTLEEALAALHDADLARTVQIRGERLTVAEALLRAVAHLAYHQGQITLLARLIVGSADWKTITIPPGGTAQHHESMGFDPRRP